MDYLLTLASPIGHVIDKPLVTNADGSIWFVSNVTVMLVVNAILTMLIMIPAAKKIRTGPDRTVDDFRSQGLMSNLVESVCVYLRENVFHDVLMDQTDRFCPILWTFFWYILICNLMGLLPIADVTSLMGLGYHGHGIGGTATQSIWVTGALAVVAFLFYNITAFIKDPKSYLLHLTGNMPIIMWPLMIPLEIMGMFIKPFALAIRLFANMTGGHLVIAVLLSFIGPLFQTFGVGGGGTISVIAVLGIVAINLLEVLVAVIQAYIFTFLVCLFLGLLVVHEHEQSHDEDDNSHAVAAH